MPASGLAPASSAGSLASFTTEDLAAASSADLGAAGRKTPKKLSWHRRFAYQRFVGWRPVLNPHSAELFFLAVGALLIGLGIPILVASLGVKEYSVRYDNAGPFSGLTAPEQQAKLLAADLEGGVNYSVDIRVEEDMQAPVWLVYQLSSYFQNYRRYVRSLDASPMHNGPTTNPTSACQPFAFAAGNDTVLPYDGAIMPCGQIANSLFNDTFTLSVGGRPIALDENAIAWQSDVDNLYGNVTAVNYNDDPATRGGGTTVKTLQESQHWVVWMRPHAKVWIQKLYAKIDQDIPAGSVVRVDVANRYNTYGFAGQKSVILTTNSWVGGKNDFLGALYIATGGVAWLLALAFVFAYDLGMVRKRAYGDLSELSWNKAGTGRPAPPPEAELAALSQGRTPEEEEGGEASEGVRPGKSHKSKSNKVVPEAHVAAS